MSWHKRIVSFGMLTLMFGNFVAVTKAQNPVEGTGIVNLTQDNQSSGQNSSPQVKQLPMPKVDLPTLRTGVDPTKVMKLSLQEAVTMALERNLGIKSEQDNIKLAQFDLEASQGVYDPIVGGGTSFFRTNIPSANPFNAGSGGSNAVTVQAFSFNLNASKQFTNGSSGEATFDVSRSTTNSNSSGLSPKFEPKFEVKFRQPLMKNFRINQNTRNIQALKKKLDLADLAFRQKLIDLVARVQSAYYDLGFAIKNAEIQRESVELAAVQLRNNEIQVKAGTAAPIDIVSAQAELERRKDAAISSLVPITQSENALKLLLLDDPISDLMNYQILPTDIIDVTGDKIDLNAAIGIAMDRRPEIKQLEVQNEVNKVDIEFFKNQLKPQVDLVSSFSLQGLAGEPGPPIIVQGVPVGLKGSEFDGGLGRSLIELFKFPTYQAGVSITLPYKNTTAKANLARTEVVTRQLDNQKRQMVLSIVTDVRNALQAVDSSLQRVEAAKASVKAAEEQLRGEEQKFAAGLSTTFFVLQRQNELSVARGNELRAKTDYNKARADLQRVMANNLP
ncbi:MAG: TolC family protein [Acidobacteria bacterium]|nr:TolC family protein [Acidobacteriota bacterium]